MSTDTTRLQRALEAIDAANAKDPRSTDVDGQPVPANLVYGQRMSAELARFAPGASEALQIAARGQHIERWIIPRSEFPMTRAGYHQWRRTLRDHHAKKLRDILSGLSFEEDTISRVSDLVRKLRQQQDPEVQTLEDVVCIVFVTYELDGFAARYTDDPDKLADILARTWVKMSPAGHAAVLALPPPEAVAALLARGLARLEAQRPG
jgi:hypothetical protein